MTAEPREISFEEAEKIDALNSRFFSADVNIGYKLGFSKARLVSKPVPKYKDPTKVEEKAVLELAIDYLDGATTNGAGEPLLKEWGLISPKARVLFEQYMKSGEILKKIFEFKHVQKGETHSYTLVAIGDKPQKN